MEYVIFSPTEGFYQTDFGWSLFPDECDTLSEDDKQHYADNPSHMPFSSANDVSIVPKANYSRVDFDDMVDRVMEVIEQSSELDILAETANSVLNEEVVALEDELFVIDGVEHITEDILIKVREAIESNESDWLADFYNGLQSNNCWFDGEDGFYHQLVR